MDLRHAKVLDSDRRHGRVRAAARAVTMEQLSDLKEVASLGILIKVMGGRPNLGSQVLENTLFGG